MPTEQQPAATPSVPTRPNFEAFQPIEDSASPVSLPPRSSTEAEPLPLKRDRSASDEGAQRGREDLPGSVGSFWTTTFALLFVVALILVMSKLLSKRAGLIGAAGLPPEALETSRPALLESKASDPPYSVRLPNPRRGNVAERIADACRITDAVEVDYLAGVCKKPDAEKSVVQNFRRLLSKSQDQHVADADPDIGETASQMEQDFNRRNAQSLRHSLLNSNQQIGNS